jgi:hypothetical protein
MRPIFSERRKLRGANLDLSERKIRKRDNDRSVLSILTNNSLTLTKSDLAAALNRKIIIDISRMVEVMLVKTKNRDLGITTEKLARVRNCGRVKLRRTR